MTWLAWVPLSILKLLFTDWSQMKREKEKGFENWNSRLHKPDRGMTEMGGEFLEPFPSFWVEVVYVGKKFWKFIVVTGAIIALLMFCAIIVLAFLLLAVLLSIEPV